MSEENAEKKWQEIINKYSEFNKNAENKYEITLLESTQKNALCKTTYYLHDKVLFFSCCFTRGLDED